MAVNRCFKLSLIYTINFHNYYVINYRQIELAYSLPPKNNVLKYDDYFLVRLQKPPGLSKCEVLYMCPFTLLALVLNTLLPADRRTMTPVVASA